MPALQRSEEYAPCWPSEFLTLGDQVTHLSKVKSLIHLLAWASANFSTPVSGEMRTTVSTNRCREAASFVRWCLFRSFSCSFSPFCLRFWTRLIVEGCHNCRNICRKVPFSKPLFGELLAVLSSSLLLLHLLHSPPPLSFRHPSAIHPPLAWERPGTYPPIFSATIPPWSSRNLSLMLL